MTEIIEMAEDREKKMAEIERDRDIDRQRWQRQQKDSREMAERDGRQRQGQVAETGTERWQRDREAKRW